MSEPIAIRRVTERLLDGTVRIPGFQRSFVWEPERAALLMDSIYKGYPVGSILLWRTQNRLSHERNLGVFELPPPDKDYPVDYVLDGQQRLTSVFSTFQTALEAQEADPEKWLPIFYDFAAGADAQDSAFVALASDDIDAERHFPLAVFFEPVQFLDATRDLGQARQKEIVGVQQRFQEALLPVETFESEDRTSVAIVFERVNRMGIELDIFQLLTAWTWSEDFDLQKKFEELSAEFESFGFESVGEDTNLMLRCASAVLKQDPLPTALVDVNGADVREAFDGVAEAIRRAIDFVRTNFHVHHLKLLPYQSVLIPLSAFFAAKPGHPITDHQRHVLCVWFWRTCFSHRYSGNPTRNIRRDIGEAIKLRSDDMSGLGDTPIAIGSGFFLHHQFNISTVASKSLILLLAQGSPRSFLSGELIKVDKVLSEPNRSEYHHCFPRAILAARGVANKQINVLANIAVITRAENRTISDSPPSAYKEHMPGDPTQVLKSQLIPAEMFDDDYESFIGIRSEILLERVAELVV